MAPDCEATHAPQRFPASFKREQIGAAQQVVGQRRGKRIARADGVGDLHRDAWVFVPFVPAHKQAAIPASRYRDHLQAGKLSKQSFGI